MLVIQSPRHCSEQILARQGEVKGKTAKLRKESKGFFFCFFMMKSSDYGRDEFSGVAWKLSGIQHSGWGWEVHSTSQERWMKTFWRLILCLSVMGAIDEVSLVCRSQTSWGDVDCHKGVVVGGCWACCCSICKHQWLELDASCNWEPVLGNKERCDMGRFGFAED